MFDEFNYVGIGYVFIFFLVFRLDWIFKLDDDYFSDDDDIIDVDCLKELYEIDCGILVLGFFRERIFYFYSFERVVFFLLEIQIVNEVDVINILDLGRQIGDVQIYIYYIKFVGLWLILIFVLGIVVFVFCILFLSEFLFCLIFFCFEVNINIIIVVWV